MPRKPNTNPISSRKPRNPLHMVPHPKKLRSQIIRRRRVPLFSVAGGSSNQLVEEAEETVFHSFPASSCSSAFIPGEISGESSLISVGSKKRRRSRENNEIGGSRAELVADARRSSRSDRPMTRSYCRLEKNARLESSEPFIQKNDRGRSDAFSQVNYLKQRIGFVQVASKSEKNRDDALSGANSSEISCIVPVFEENSGQKTGSSKKHEISVGIQGNELSTETISEVSCIEPCFPKNSKPKTSSCIGNGNSLQIAWNAGSSTGVSEQSCLESLSAAKTQNLDRDRGTTDSKSVVSEPVVNLACSEQLSNDDGESEYSTCHEMTLSEMEEEIFPKNSDGECVDFSQQSISSFFNESSADDFSEQSAENNSGPSECFSLFLQYLQQFLSSAVSLQFKASHLDEEDDYSDEFTLLRFEDEEHEESYRRFRSRERKQLFLQDYVEEYSAMTVYGGLVVQQRLLMVHWIVQHCMTHQLRYETLFLSVSLLDRFLSRGFFTSQRNLQILGIACCTLATRIEENQPLNCVRQKTFQVGSNAYRRCEVVAMEWLLQEVLEFQCFMPTTYNFLWFYLKAASADEEIEDHTKYLATLSLLDHHCLCFWPSSVAAGLVILSSLASNRDCACQRVMETHVRTKNDDLPECIQSLEWLVKYAC